MTKKQAIAFFGTQKRLAEALKIKQPTVAGWVNNQVPLEHQYYLQKITRGKLRADPHPAEIQQ